MEKVTIVSGMVSHSLRKKRISNSTRHVYLKERILKGEEMLYV